MVSKRQNSGDGDVERRLVKLLRQREVESQRFRKNNISSGKFIHPFTRKPVLLSSLPDAFPPGASERKLDNFTRRTGVELPQSLRKWLRITNGACGFFGVRPRRNTDDIEHEWDFWGEMQDRGWLPVAFDDFGNRYVQLIPSQFPDQPVTVEPVCYVEMIGGYISHVVASDMLQFAAFSLDEDLSGGSPWPFDKKYTISRDPNIVNVNGLPLPWDR